MDLFNQLGKKLRQYKVASKRAMEKVTFKDTLLAVIKALGITFLILLIPILLVINLWIIPELYIWLRIMILLIAVSYVYFYFTFYYYFLNVQVLKDMHPIKMLKWIEVSITWIFVVPILIFILTL